MTLKEMLDEALLQCGLPTETEYASNDDDSVARFASIASNEAAKLSRYPWQALRKSYEFTLTSAESYTLPSDFRAFVPDTMYEEGDTHPAEFPTSAANWQMLKASSTNAGDLKVRIMGDAILVHEPEAGETVRFEYWSKYPAKNAAGTAKQYFTVDTDTFVLDDDLLIMRLIARIKRLNGLPDWQVDMAEAMKYEQELKGQDSGSRTVGPSDDGFSKPHYELWRPVPNDP